MGEGERRAPAPEAIHRAGMPEPRREGRRIPRPCSRLRGKPPGEDGPARPVYAWRPPGGGGFGHGSAREGVPPGEHRAGDHGQGKHVVTGVGREAGEPRGRGIGRGDVVPAPRVHGRKARDAARSIRTACPSGPSMTLPGFTSPWIRPRRWRCPRAAPRPSTIRRAVSTSRPRPDRFPRRCASVSPDSRSRARKARPPARPAARRRTRWGWRRRPRTCPSYRMRGPAHAGRGRSSRPPRPARPQAPPAVIDPPVHRARGPWPMTAVSSKRRRRSVPAGRGTAALIADPGSGRPAARQG